MNTLRVFIFISILILSSFVFINPVTATEIDITISAGTVYAKYGNGTTISSGIAGIDDTVVIQAGFDAVVLDGDITFDGSTYNISASITSTDKNLTIMGCNSAFDVDTGSSAACFDFDGSYVGTTTFAADEDEGNNSINLTDASSISVGDLLRIYNDVAWCPDDYPTLKTGESYIVSGVSGNIVTLNSNLIRDYTTAQNSAVRIYNSVIINIDNCIFNGTGSDQYVRAIVLERSKNSSISNCYMNNFGLTSIDLYTCHGVNISGSEIYNSSYSGLGYGVAIANACTNITIYDNDIRYCRHCITSGRSEVYGVNREIEILNNTIHNGSNSVIDAHPATIDYLVANNTIYTEGHTAFDDGTLESIYQDNYIYNGTGFGIRGQVKNSTRIIRRNNFYYATITTESDAVSIKSLTINDNVVYGGSTLYGFFMDYVDVETFIFNNNSIEERLYGFRMRINESEASNIHISDNTFKTIDKDAIYIVYKNLSYNECTLTINDNIIENANRVNSDYHGIKLYNTQNATIYNNQISDSDTYTRYGIYEASCDSSDCDYNTYWCNVFTGMQTGDYYLQGASSVIQPCISFISPTLANDSTTTNVFVEINASIVAYNVIHNLIDFVWNWNGTNTTFLNDSCILHISFDNNSAIGENSTVAVDVSQYGNNGSFIDGSTGNWTTNGKWNGAISLDGVDDYINCGNDSSLDITDAITIEAIINPASLSGSIHNIVSKSLSYYFDIDNKKLRMYLYGLTVNGITASGADDIPLDTNTSITGTYNGSYLILYINGIQVASEASTGNIDIDTKLIQIGGRGTDGHDDRYLNGTLDNVRVYNYAKSADEVYQSHLSNLQKYNSTQWYFESNQTNLSEGEYNYQIFANNIESDYRVVTLGQMYNISGIITDNNGDTLAGVTVSDNESVDSNVSYGAGIYNLTGYLNDTYNLTFSKSGFDTGYLEVTISGADNTTANKQIFDNTPPGQVTGLTEDSKNQTTVNISWTVVSGADSYQIFRNDSSQGYTTNLYYNDTGLTENTNYGYVVRANDSYDNWGANSSELAVTTESDVLVVTLLSMTPSTICQNCTGNISILYGISHSSAGLNNTSVSFIYRDYDHDLSDSNHSIRPPINNLASEWNYDGRILRGANRNESLNFENNATITGGNTYSWSGLDENNSEMSIVYVNSSYTKVYINSTIHRVMPQMHYIDRSELQEAPKTTIAIHKNQDVLVKFWNFEIFKGNTDFLGVGYTDTTLNNNPALQPSDTNPVNYHYISSGYDPLTGGDPLTSGYAVYMGSLNATGWVDHVYSPHANSSYTRGFINNTLLHSYINTTNISYVLYTSNTPSNKGYLINVTDVATSSNVSFANTSVLWAGDNAMSAEPYTPNIWFAFMKDNISFDHKLYAADNNDLWGNSTINSTTIGEALFPPTKPSFYSFHNGDTDYNMNGTYSGTFNVQISPGADPDGGDVVHNVSVYYGNGTYIDSIFNTSCNTSCLYMNVSFDSTSYYSPAENYTLKVVATDDEGESITTCLGVNFSLGLHVSGTVYGGDNIGLSDVSMTLGSYSTTTASDGTFLFTGISDGSHILTSYIDGYDTLSKTVIVSGADVTGQDFYYDIIVDRGGGGGSGGFISIVEILDEDGEVIGKAIAIGKPGEAWFTIDLVSISRLLSGIDAKNTWSFIGILSSISILAGLFDTSKTARPELLLILGFVGIGLYAIYQSKLAIVIGFG